MITKRAFHLTFNVTLGGARPVNIKLTFGFTSSSWIKTVFSYKMTLGAEI